MKSTLFLNSLTCVDHAFINDKGQVIGGSYHPNFEVTGQVEEVENVVVDFSKVKKELKAFVDDKENGFDHKLWIISGYSNVTSIQETGGYIRIETPALKLEMPRNAVKVFESSYNDSFIDTLEGEFNTYLTKLLSEAHPELGIEVKTTMTTDTFSTTDSPQMFRYSHGLKNSSSWGCQNHSHGHLSFIEFPRKARSDAGKSQSALYAAVAAMSNSLFINKENITADTPEALTIEYTTPRGRFWAEYNKSLTKMEVLDTETTIEFIAEWFVNKHRQILEDAGVVRVFISEGLSKGAVVDL